MALQFVFGGSGSGKSHYLYQNITKEAEENPSLSYLVLVPEQFTMQTQKDLVMHGSRKGIMNIDVLSFVRLAHRIFEETGKGGFPVLDDEGKNLVLRKIGGELESRLKVLKGNMRKLGYVSEVKSVLSEFIQYDVGMDEIRKVMESSGEDSYLYYKLSDIALLYQGFQDYLREKFITKEELLDVLSRVACESEILRKSTVVLDGFTGFTPVQGRLLGELMKICRDVIVTVTIDEREDPYTFRHPYQLFAMSKQTVASLLETAKKKQIPVKAPVVLKRQPAPRFENCPAIGFLEREIFRYSGKTYTGQQSAVELHVARNPMDEAWAAAERVRRMIRTEGYRYREIGIIVSDMDTYGNSLKRAFGRYEIPVFMDQKRSILLNSFVEYIRSLLTMAEQNFSFESVFRFLRTGYAGFEAEEIDELENYCLALGVKGFAKWQERWIRRSRDMTEEELERVNHLRVMLVELVDDLVFVLKQKKKTVRDITEALYDFLVREKMQLVLKEQEEQFQAEGEMALAREYAQIYGIVLDLFDKFVQLLGDETVTLEEYCSLLDAGLTEAKVGVIPPGIDQVVIGDMQRTRLKDIKALLFLGANDSFLPGNLMQAGLLSEGDRTKFAREKIALTPGAKEQAYVQKYYLYLNLTKPTEKLCVFYSKVSADGKSVRPSYLIQEIRRLFPEISVEDEEEKALKEKEMTPESGITELTKGLQGRDDASGSAWMELYSWYKGEEKWQGKLSDLLDAAYYVRPSDAVSEAVAKKIYGDDFRASITRMERFSSCAFSHFLTYGLALKERQEYEFRAADMGNVFHSAVEKYAGKLSESKRSWISLTLEEQKELSDQCVDEAVTDYGNSVLYSTSRNQYMVTRMKHMMNRTVWALTEQLRRGDFQPEASELSFGSGKIDRVDTCLEDDTVYVKVVDYKTGRTAFDFSLLYHGLQLQLMVYMNQALGLVKRRYPDKEAVPSGIFYYRIQDPLVEKGDDKETVKEKLLKELRPDGLISLEKNSLAHLEHGREGESLAVPVKFKKDGSLAASSKAVDGSDFAVLSRYAGEKVKELHERIASGEAKISPYRQGTRTGCDYCAYRHICGFDTKIPGYHYRDIEKLDRQEAIERMGKQIEESTEKSTGKGENDL